MNDAGKIVGRKIINIIKVQKEYDTLSGFTVKYGLEPQYNNIRRTLKGDSRLTLDNAIELLTFIYGSESMAYQKLSEILHSVVKYKED